ncbi:MAG: glycoside hydrolase family 3 protein [Bryobacteraceae bacterium]|nr:glycoside hydrolase family 3 protein [Bryobacteraceae bacterium]
MTIHSKLALPAIAALAAFSHSGSSAETQVQTPALLERWKSGMTLREQIAQLVVIPFYGDLPGPKSLEHKRFLHLVSESRVGGLILVNRVQNGIARNAEPHEMASFINRMQKAANVPLIVAGDFERGASMRVSGTTKWPHNMAFGAARDYEASRAQGAYTAEEARALGVHWVFAPDADVNNNPANPIIGIRSYGENPWEVASHVRSYIEGARSAVRPVLVTAKHFPGHGDTAVDSHVGLPRLNVAASRLEEVELIPFRAAIDAGVDSIMTAHVSVPALDPSDTPATVSHAILTGVLRKELGFQGIIVTDAMDMQGLTKILPGGEAAVRAIEAGADVLLMPPDPDKAIAAVLKAVNSGRISRQRIEESLERVLAAKFRVGLGENNLVDLRNISRVVNSPEPRDCAQQVAARAITLVKNQNDILPLEKPASACHFILSESRLGQSGRKLAELLAKELPGALWRRFTPATPAIELSKSAKEAEGCKAVVIYAFVSVAAYRGNAALPGGYPKFVEQLIAGPVPVVMVSLGNPYLLSSFPRVAAYLNTYSTAPTSEVAALKAIKAEIPIEGHLPVTIPDIAPQGAGIQLSARLQ